MIVSMSLTSSLGCGVNTDTLYIPPEVVDAHPDHAEAMFDAADMWCASALENKRAGGDACVDVKIGRGPSSMRVNPQEIVRDRGYNEVAYTECTAMDCDIVFATKMEDGKPITWHANGECQDEPGLDVNIQETALHELGHFFGYDHQLDNADSIMSGSTNCWSWKEVCSGELPHVTCEKVKVERDHRNEWPDGSKIR